MIVIDDHDTANLTVGDLLNQVSALFEQAEANGELFFGHGTDNAWDESVWLILSALDMPAASDESVLARPVSADEVARVKNLVERRVKERVPVAYLTHKAWFCGLPFYVDDRVLVPRSPLAELIENQFSPWLLDDPVRILDLCTGSGCIGIACAYYFPNSQVVLSDISYDALAVAKHNIEEHQLFDRAVVVQSDLFSLS